MALARGIKWQVLDVTNTEIAVYTVYPPLGVVISEGVIIIAEFLPEIST